MVNPASFVAADLGIGGIARATAATNAASLSVGHRSTYAETKVFRIFYCPPQIGEFPLPIADSVARYHAAMFERISHTTQFALRTLRNTTGPWR